MTRDLSVPRTGPNAVDPLAGGNRRPPGGGRTRFVGTGHHGDRALAGLRADHPAVVEGRSLFPTRVFQMDQVDRVLIDGRNNPKIGAHIERGPWAPMPVLTLTLEERATCPRTCGLWRECMGNAMHFAKRHAHGPQLEADLEVELDYYNAQDDLGFAVRLHILGDFYSLEYVASWRRWMQMFPALHVWGYTARLPGTDIGDAIAALNKDYPDRWRIRFSVAPGAPHGPLQVSTIWRKPDAVIQPEGSVCPQSMEKTATCGTCGLCWARANDDTRILFVGHGMRSSGQPK